MFIMEWFKKMQFLNQIVQDNGLPCIIWYSPCNVLKTSVNCSSKCPDYVPTKPGLSATDQTHLKSPSTLHRAQCSIRPYWSTYVWFSMRLMCVVNVGHLPKEKSFFFLFYILQSASSPPKRHLG